MSAASHVIDKASWMTESKCLDWNGALMDKIINGFQ